MRKGISITVTPADRVRLQSIIRDRNTPQKHVWRARIIVLTGDGEGTTAVAGRNPLGRPIDRSAGLIAPSRVVINAVGRVGDLLTNE
jgi:hypothetical protein